MQNKKFDTGLAAMIISCIILGVLFFLSETTMVDKYYKKRGFTKTYAMVTALNDDVRQREFTFTYDAPNVPEEQSMSFKDSFKQSFYTHDGYDFLKVGKKVKIYLHPAGNNIIAKDNPHRMVRLWLFVSLVLTFIATSVMRDKLKDKGIIAVYSIVLAVVIGVMIYSAYCDLSYLLQLNMQSASMIWSVSDV